MSSKTECGGAEWIVSRGEAMLVRVDPGGTQGTGFTLEWYEVG